MGVGVSSDKCIMNWICDVYLHYCGKFYTCTIEPNCIKKRICKTRLAKWKLFFKSVEHPFSNSNEAWSAHIPTVITFQQNMKRIHKHTQWTKQADVRNIHSIAIRWLKTQSNASRSCRSWSMKYFCRTPTSTKHLPRKTNIPNAKRHKNKCGGSETTS